MTIDSNTSDRALHERVPSPAASTAVAAVTTRNDEAAADGDHELDREVSHFLESEFFAPQYDNAASQPLHSAFLKEELLFMDISESIDMPDLDYDCATTPDNRALDSSSSDVHASVDFLVDNGDSTTSQPLAPTPIEEPPMHARPSLRVVIPASALAMAPTATAALPSAAAGRPSLIDPLLPPSLTTGRKRVKYELEYLRQQVQQFEAKLAYLKQGSAAGDTSPPSALSALSLSEDSAAPFSETPSQAELWRRIAEHQHVQKQKSELENAKLRAMLESQLKIARSLSRVLRKRQDLSWLDSPRLDETAKRHCTAAGAVNSENDANESTFQNLAMQVETLYAQLDTVLAESGINAAPAQETQGGEVKTNADGRVFLEVVDVAAVPFDVHTTGAAMWKLMCSPHMAVGDVIYQAVDATDDSVRAVLTVTLRMRQQTTTFHLHLVTKRIVEAHRTVHLWCSRGEINGGLFGNECVQVRECAWSVIQAASRSGAEDCSEMSHDNSSAHEPLTIMQNVVRMTPLLDKNIGDSVGVLTDVCLSSFRQNITTMRQMMEDIVLEGAA